MARVQEIRGMAEWYATDIASSPADWMKYLDTAARLYRYSFTDQLLIYAQRPQATACASLELWNEKMMRWVNRGAKGIALLDETGTKAKIRYVSIIKIPIWYRAAGHHTCGSFRTQREKCLHIFLMFIIGRERYGRSGRCVDVCGKRDGQ